jgi:hypothetical protein
MASMIARALKLRLPGGFSFGKGTRGGQGGNRTPDASLFRAALYQLSYLALDTVF